MADNRFIVKIDPEFTALDGTRLDALIAALDHFNIPAMIVEVPDQDDPAKVVLELDNGLVTEVLSDRPVEFLIHDRDIDGVAAENLAVRPSMHNPGVEVTVFKTFTRGTTINPALVNNIMQVAQSQNTD